MKGTCLAIVDGKHFTRDQIQEKYEIADEFKKMLPGDFVAIEFDGTVTSLFICCPGCGDCSFTGNHKINYSGSYLGSLDGRFTLIPSLVFSCCSWHGHLTESTFIKA